MARLAASDLLEDTPVVQDILSLSPEVILMKHSRIILFALAVALAVGMMILKWKAEKSGDPLVSQNHSLTKPASASEFADDVVSRAFDAFRVGTPPEVSRRSLLKLRNSLVSMPNEQAVAEIREFLSSGRDFPTGLPFDIAADGSLTTSPTFRCFLLDLLSTVDASAAAATGREILAQSTTADEWALALRNVGRGEPRDQNVGFLQRKTEELIANPSWQAKPSIGYLNAFDVLVYSEAVGSAPLLSDLIRRKDRKELVHAGFLTLDRLVLRRPVELLTFLANDRVLQESRPEAVAQQFARADVRVPAQRDILKAWLLDAVRTPEELNAFTSIYPNSNRFVSNNLLTVESPPSGADLVRHDEAALLVFSDWATDAEFAPVRKSLNVTLTRLESFVKSRERR